MGGGNVIAVKDNTLQRTTVRVSYSPTGEPILDSYYSGADFNRDGGTDGVDLAAFLAAYAQGDETANLDQNGGIDGTDLALFFTWYESGFVGDHTLSDQRFLYRVGGATSGTTRSRCTTCGTGSLPVGGDPARMLWIQRDPLGRIPGSNEYAYCLGEPVDLFDPMGLYGWGDYWHDFAEGAREFRDQFTGKAAQEDAHWEQEAQNTASKQWSKAMQSKNTCQAQAILTLSKDDIARVQAANDTRHRKFIELYVSVSAVAVLPAAAAVEGMLVAGESELVAVEVVGAVEAEAATAAAVETTAVEATAAETATAETAAAGTGPYSAIGSTGQVGENALKTLGGESQVYYKTSQGGRYIDQLVEGVAHESKVGYKSLTSEIERQIAKDAELIGSGDVKGSVWHFFESPVTGLRGASQPLLDALEKAGIRWVLE